MGLKSLSPKIKLTIGNARTHDDAALGPGVVALCEGVRKTGSLNAAAKEMGMAYSKAWKIVRETEEALGVILLQRDGARGSTLTKQATTLLDAYRTLQESLDESAKKLYRSLV